MTQTHQTPHESTPTPPTEASAPTESGASSETSAPTEASAPAESGASTEASAPTPIIADVAVIGGGAAGLAAAIALARSLRRVVVIDAGQPRNRTSAHAHNLLGNEGINPLDLADKGRAEAESYGVTFVDDTVITAVALDGGPSLAEAGVLSETSPSEAGVPSRTSSSEEGTSTHYSPTEATAAGRSTNRPAFALDTAGGTHVEAQHLIIATGLTDELPDIPGLADGWGDTVLHCPYCHGYEVRGQRIAVIGTTALSYHQAMMFSQLSDHIMFLRHEAPTPTEEQTAMLRTLGIEFVDAHVDGVSRNGTATEITVEAATTSARGLTVDAIAVGPFFRVNGELFEQLGGTVVDDPSGMGSTIPTDPTGRTDIPGVWAVGNSADMSAMIGASAASGVKTGAMVNYELIQSRLAGDE